MKKVISIFIALFIFTGCTAPDEEGIELGVNIALGNVDRTITYNQSDPLEMPDGTIVTNGELKPVWQQYEDALGINIVDNTIQDQEGTEMIEIEAATQFSDSVMYGGNSVAESLAKYGAEGYFIDLNDYADQLPNFMTFLDENDGIREAITAYDGGLYYFPYIAELGNYARTFNLRESWVTTLLDGEATLENEDETLAVAYEPYWTEDGKTVIDLQDEKAKDGELSAVDARTVLVDYINDNYDYDKPSELFLGEDAMYNMDELVALLRCVKLHPNTLTKVTTGKVVEDAYIAPYFVRQTKYREDILRLITYFGGTRVFGADSYATMLVYDEDGNLEYSYADDEFLDGLERVHQIYSEGLIAQEFADQEDTTNFRTEYYGKDGVEGHGEFGFMTNDWIQSTTALSTDVVGVLPPVTTIGDSDEMVHYVENTRTIKPDGWSISIQSSEEEIEAALELADYLYSPEGMVTHNYGTSTMVDDSQMYTGPDGIEYPKFDDWIFEMADKYKSGDVSSFLRDYVGALIPIGYVKEIGFEYQSTSETGNDAWKLYQNADVIMPTYDTDNPLLKLTPSAYSLNDNQYKRIETTDIGTTQTDNIFLYIIGAANGPQSIEEISQNFEDKGIERYEEVYNEALQLAKEREQ